MWNEKEKENLVEILKEDGIAVMLTDTVYGIVGRAESPIAVEKVYKVRSRNESKPCIVLIGSVDELEKFSISLNQEQKNILNKYWPGPVSIILDCPDEKFKYLHRGTKTLAFRLPSSEEFQKLLIETGPLVAPSANPEGLPVANTITDAKEYFGNTVDMYLDGGELYGKPSKLIKLSSDGSVSILRE